MQDEIFLDEESVHDHENHCEILDYNEPIIIDAEEIIPIVISNLKTPELILGKRYNDSTERIEFLVKFIELPIENADWMVKEKIQNLKLINNFEKKKASSERF